MGIAQASRRVVLFASIGLLMTANTTFATAPPIRLPIWVGTWATSQMAPDDKNALSPTDANDVTVRQIVRISAGGWAFRVRISNALNSAPLTIKSVHIARSLGGSRIDAASDQTLTFGGHSEITIPALSDYISDPVGRNEEPLADLAISFYIATAPVHQTSHPGARATSYAVHGDHAADAELVTPLTFTYWFNLSGVDVQTLPEAYATAVLGDSITDGYGVKPDTNMRWTDVLARRLHEKPIGVLNEGIGGNRLLDDGLGPSALSRFDRDVLSQSGIKKVIVFEGVNDLGTATRDAPISPEAHAVLVARIVSAYQQMIYKAHSHGLTIVGTTITPFTGSDYYHPDASVEADRQAVNTWIRASGHFDAVIDFDSIMRDPTRPERLQPALDSGDHLHPSEAGYRLMGESVSLTLFAN